MSYKTEGIILNARESRQYDRIYTVFSREKGKISVIGIGTRKPQAKLASGLEPLTKSELFLIKCRGLDRVKGVLIDKQYPKIKGDYEKLLLVRRTVRILEWLLPAGERCEELFDALSIFLANVEKQVLTAEQHQRALVLAQLALFWQVLAWSGIVPSLYCCTVCRKRVQHREKLIFAVPNGLRCATCAGHDSNNFFQITPDTVKLLRIILKADSAILAKIKVSRQILTELHNITRHMLADITERRVVF